MTHTQACGLCRGTHAGMQSGVYSTACASSDEEHRNICTRLQLLPIKSVCLVGKEFQQFKNEFGFNFFLTVDELNEWLKNNPFENETVLIKGSRGNRLEKAAELLLA